MFLGLIGSDSRRDAICSSSAPCIAKLRAWFASDRPEEAAMASRLTSGHLEPLLDPADGEPSRLRTRR